jgi:hypothetical protein
VFGFVFVQTIVADFAGSSIPKSTFESQARWSSAIN